MEKLEFKKSDVYITAFLAKEALNEMLNKAKENNPDNISDEKILENILNEIVENPKSNTANYFQNLMKIGSKTVEAIQLNLPRSEIANHALN